ncbi:ATG18A [Symbiodinium pilosum]|uniref:ATG18A protein n=1 Tax=Symbiodinium pilosum TaxID=2952 RepID=A0A812LGR2_SYMPI|nr:ATG18A [Symbiodinium pilosum]
MFYMDHFRFQYKFRREHFDRRKYQEPMYVENYTTPEFRFPGFWPGKFGYHQTTAGPEQTQLLPPNALQGEESSAPRGPAIMPAARRGPRGIE